jgi:hypothetical protein
MPFYAKNCIIIILPRQARDKHREINSTQKQDDASPQDGVEVHRSLEKHRWIDVTYESRCFTMLCRFEQRFHRAGPLAASDVSKLDTEPMAYIVRTLFILVRPRLTQKQ